MLEVIEEAMLEESYSAWEHTAMIGFQDYILSPYIGKGKRMNFDKWKQSLGIVRPKSPKTGKRSKLTRAEEIAKARQAVLDSGFGDALGTL